MLNIAEGAERYSDVMECVSCLDCAVDDGYISQQEHNEGLTEAEEIVRQLKALSSKVRKDNKKF